MNTITVHSLKPGDRIVAVNRSESYSGGSGSQGISYTVERDTDLTEAAKGMRATIQNKINDLEASGLINVGKVEVSENQLVVTLL